MDLEVVKILRYRVRECVRREGVNHPQRCREHVDAYWEAFHKYKSEGIDVFLGNNVYYIFVTGWSAYH